MSDLDPLILKLQRAKLAYSIAWNQPETLARVKAPRAALERAAAEFFEALQPPASVPYQGDASHVTAQELRAGRYLQGKERADSLIDCLEAVAKGRGAGLYQTKSLHSAVVDYAPAGDKVWWHQQPAGLVVGILRNEPAVTQVLKQRGVLIWEGAANTLNAGDELWRLVHVEHLTAHQDILNFVLDSTPAGRHCRFCQIQEPPESRELQPLTLERQDGVTVVNGVVSLTPGAVLTHELCRPHWLRWLEIASRHGSEEQAKAADTEANRKPREQRAALPSVKLDRPIAAQSNESGEASPDFS